MELHWNTAIHHEGYLYACSGQRPNGAELRCVELKTGKVMWDQRVDERASLLWVNNYFIYLGEYGRLMLLKCTPEKLEVISQVTSLRDKNGRPVSKISCLGQHLYWRDGYLYIRGKDRLVCLDLRFEYRVITFLKPLRFPQRRLNKPFTIRFLHQNSRAVTTVPSGRWIVRG